MNIKCDPSRSGILATDLYFAQVKNTFMILKYPGRARRCRLG
jgi:hypothetical protein